MTNPMWTTIAAERGALADDLATLSDDQWQTPSLSSDWTVQQALAHMTATAQKTPVGFVKDLLTSGFKFSAMQAKDIAAAMGASPAETLANFRAIQHSTDAPPGPATSWLGEAIVHAEDIRRPLGIAHDYPVDALVQVADFYKNSNMLIGTKKRIAGLTLKATDTDWTHGTGPVVEGPMLSLLMAMTGRRAALADLTGPGVEQLTQRP